MATCLSIVSSEPLKQTNIAKIYFNCSSKHNLPDENTAQLHSWSFCWCYLLCSFQCNLILLSYIWNELTWIVTVYANKTVLHLYGNVMSCSRKAGKGVSHQLYIFLLLHCTWRRIARKSTTCAFFSLLLLKRVWQSYRLSRTLLCINRKKSLCRTFRITVCV